MPYGATGRDPEDFGVGLPEPDEVADGRRRAHARTAQRLTARARAGWRGRSGLAKAGYVMATLVAVVAVAAGVAAFALYRQLDGSITKVQVGGPTGPDVFGAQDSLV